ncbi:amidohydrolase family protein, partial [Streptomyces clavuligerus]
SARTVLPGLWDTHTHPWPSSYGGRQTTGALTYGVTTTVSFGGFAHEQVRIREAVHSGQLAGPRLLTCGEPLDGSRAAYSMCRVHRTRAGLRRTLERGVALDWDTVKTYVRAPAWVMEEAARFAHERLGVRSGSHFLTPGILLGQDLTTHLQATQRAEAGHATTASGRAHQDVMAVYSARGADFSLVATPFTAAPLIGSAPELADDPRVTVVMAPWDAALVRLAAAQPPTADQLATLDTEIDVYRRVLAAGGAVALGTDAPLGPAGLSLHLGLRALRRSGLSAARALSTATVIPARVFGLGQHLGTVERGRLADLAIVDGDPFEDFDTLIRTVSCLRGGVVYETDDLIAATAAPTTAAAEPLAADRTDWLSVGTRMHRDGCCDPGV